jgi:type I restriction enzyme S subunit
VSGFPKSWVKIPLGDDADAKKGKKPKTLFTEHNSELVPYIDIKAFEKGIYRKYATLESGVECEINDSLMVWDGARSGLVGNGVAGILGSTLMRIRPKVSINRYLHYFLLSKFSEINSQTKGTGIPHVDPAILWNFEYPTAPLSEQIRIADKLDSMLAKVDASQARLDKIPNILKRFRQSVLAAATSGELTKEWRGNNEYKYKRKNIEGKFELDWEIVKERTLPQHWQWVPLGNFAKCARGKFSIRPRNDPSCFDGAYPFIQIGDLPREGGNIISHKQTLNDKGYSVSREFEIGTVVIAIVGATIANTGIVTYPVCFPDSLVGINSPSNIENQYLDYHLRAVKEEIRQASYAGGGQPNVKLTMINPLPLPLPPYEEILEIVRRVESLFTMAATVEKQYKDTKARTNRLTQSILAKAFRGELVPQDENDEPASVLLARIEAELTAINTKVKAKPKTKKKIKAV